MLTFARREINKAYARSFYSGAIKQLSVRDMLNKKRASHKISMVTGYDVVDGTVADFAMVDMVLIGDSVANVVLGHKKTASVNESDMLHHINAVSRGCNRAIIVGDLPLSSSTSIDKAVAATLAFQNAGCNAVKIEGGDPRIIAELSKIIPVVAHIGVQPQTAASFTTQGLTASSAIRLGQDAQIARDSGASFIVLEKVSSLASKGITSLVGPNCATIGIGSGPYTDGQVLVMHDLLGVTLPGQRPLPFAKSFFNPTDLLHTEYFNSVPRATHGVNPYGGDGFQARVNAVRQFKKEVEENKFPCEGHYQDMKDRGEIEKFQNWVTNQTVSRDAIINSVAQLQEPSSSVRSCQTEIKFSMDEKKAKVLIIGSGAISSYLLAVIKKNQPDSEVSILTNWITQGSHLTSSSGVNIINSQDSKFNVKADAFFTDLPEHLLNSFDVVFISNKVTSDTHATKTVNSAIQAAKKYSGAIISVQNGLLTLEACRKAFQISNANPVGTSSTPNISLLFATTTMGAKVMPGDISVSPVIKIEGDATFSAATLFGDATTPTVIGNHFFPVKLFPVDNGNSCSPVFKAEPNGALQKIIWRKLAVNSAINPLTSLLNIPNGAILQEPQLLSAAEAVALETARVARSRNIDLTDSETLHAVRTTLQSTTNNISSMLADLRRGATATEIDSISGAIVREAIRGGERAPLNFVLSNVIESFSQIRGDSRGSLNGLLYEEGMRRAFSVSDLKKCRADSIKKNRTVAYVPTMGGLHSGHLDLIKKAKTLADDVYVSLFLNPRQFQDQNDFSTYPLSMANDLQMLKDTGAVSVVFTPTVDTVYPEPKAFSPVVEMFEDGEHIMRPGFFNGITDVLVRFFSWFQPDIAVFGQKDFQQVCMVRRLLRDVVPTCELHVEQTVRESSGLALSSRNARLSAAELDKAPFVFKSMSKAKDVLDSFLFKHEGELRSLQDVANIVERTGASLGGHFHYINFANATSGKKLDNQMTIEQVRASLGEEGLMLHVSGSVENSSVRLIDNLRLF